MGKIYTALGLMSGTSMDGVDASIIKSDGNTEYSLELDKYFEYDKDLIKKLSNIRFKITIADDLKRISEEIKELEREITLFHVKVVNEILNKSGVDIDLIGFHGHTIFHDSNRKISIQLGDGKLMSQLTKKKVVYNFRQNDLQNGGQGAPLTPIFHNMISNKIVEKFKLKFPINFLNIGGIANITLILKNENLSEINKIFAHDIGPGNCLIDEWMRKNSKENFDSNGQYAKSGKTDNLILNQAFENLSANLNYGKSLDIKDFDIFFAKGLSLEDGASTITDLSAKIIADGIDYINSKNNSAPLRCLVCGGGRKNKYLLDKLKNYFNKMYIEPIDNYDIDGDFIESQAFAYLAIRSIENMPISFPSTTRCNQISTGGVLVENF